DPVAAAACYERALDAQPTDVAAAEALAELLEDDDARVLALADRFEIVVRNELRADPLDPSVVRKLLSVAAFRGDADLEFRVLDTLVALRQEALEEREAHLEARAELPSDPLRPLSAQT